MERIKRKPTNKMIEALKFCEYWCEIKFKGDINSFSQVSEFLSKNLDISKDICETAREAYYNQDY